SIRSWLGFALQQSAAESYLHGIDLDDPEAIRRSLLAGNNNTRGSQVASLVGKTRMTGPTADPNSQVRVFESQFKIISHQENDRSGFSATLIQRIADDNGNSIENGEYTLSF